MRAVWLLRGDDVLASGEVAETWGERMRGLVGRPGYEGALLVLGWRSAHSCGMRFPLDVAFLDEELVVVATAKLRPWSVSLPRRGACHVLQARMGAFERWELRPGDKVEIRETS